MDVGREVKKYLDEDISAGRIPTEEPQRADTPLPPHLATVLISNFGIVQPFAEARGMKITDFQTLSPPKVGTYPVYGVYTFEGRLNIPIRYPLENYPVDLTQTLITDILNTLQELGSFAAQDAVGTQSS